MANYKNLIEAIKKVIYSNKNQEITGDVLQAVLIKILSNINNWQFKGIAYTTTNPGTPDANIFYLASSGVYVNFNNITVNSLAVLYNDDNNNWQKTEIDEILNIKNDTLTLCISKLQILPKLNCLDKIKIDSWQNNCIFETQFDNWHTSDFIELDNTSIYNIVLNDSASEYFSLIRLYDTNKNEIIRINGESKAAPYAYKLIPLHNMKYIRVASLYLNDTNSTIIYKHKNIDQLQAATQVTSNTYHKVLWLGTSIPAGSYIENGTAVSYPKLVCDALGWTLYNNSIGSSGIVKHNGILNNDRDGRDLSESSSEKVSRYKDYIGDGTDGTITNTRYTEMMNWGYDKLIIPYIDGSIADCDMIVFDHGFNDREVIANELDNFGSLEKSLIKDASNDRNSFLGAFRFLLNRIYSVNPKIKVVIVSYLENQSHHDSNYNRCGYEICKMQKSIAETYNLPFINMCDYNGFIMRITPGTDNYISNFNKKYGTDYKVANYMSETFIGSRCSLFQVMCPDSIHPHTDMTHKSLKIIGNNLIKLMKDL